MKKIVIIIIVLVASAINAVYSQTSIRQYFDVGDTINVYPKVEWIKGTAVDKFDPAKIYIVDLWATWCKPCIAAMPHLNEMALKFKDRGIIFVAQDVMEDDKPKVLDFLKANDKMMSFNVAFGGGKGSEFERDWIKPAGVNAIPQTFVIKGNKLLWQTSPDMINEAVIEMLIKGEFTIDKAKMAISKGK